MRRYPHLLTVDVPVWERWLSRHGDQYYHIDYDVRVGQPRDPGPEFEANIRAMALTLSYRRIDAVAWSTTHVLCIEITRRAGMTTLGQAISYPTLLTQTYPVSLPVRTLIVCEEMDANIQAAANAHRIPYQILPPETTQSQPS